MYAYTVSTLLMFKPKVHMLGECVGEHKCMVYIIPAVRQIYYCMVHCRSAGIWKAVLPLPLSHCWVVGTERASLCFLKTHELHGATLCAGGQGGVLLPTGHARAYKTIKNSCM